MQRTDGIGKVSSGRIEDDIHKNQSKQINHLSTVHVT